MKIEQVTKNILGIYLNTVQYHIKKLRKYKEMYKELISSIKAKGTFIYFIIDELYTFIKRKDEKAYVWAVIAVDRDNKKHYL